MRTLVKQLQYLLAAVLLCNPIIVQAHDNRPLFVEIIEREHGLFTVHWGAPQSLPALNIPRVVLPSNCLAVAPGPAQAEFGYANSRLQRCQGGLDGKQIEIRYPVLNPSLSTLIRLRWNSGESHSALLAPHESTFVVPHPETRSGVAREYLNLGVRHILTGYDHLLFLLCLFWIAGTGWRILIAVTGFTLAHSLTLALSALRLVDVPSAPVEAVIALSILFLAVELARGKRNTLVFRHPVSASTAFGLLHGLGFAAVLTEIGLPQTEIPLALFFFNVGVEIGQVVFIVSLIIILATLSTLANASKKSPATHWSASAGVRGSVVYCVGIIASFWMIQRVASFWALS